MDNLLSEAAAQAPALAIFAGTIAWLVRTFLTHTSTIMEDHARALSEIMSRYSEVVADNTKTLGGVQEALRNSD